MQAQSFTTEGTGGRKESGSKFAGRDPFDSPRSSGHSGRANEAAAVHIWPPAPALISTCMDVHPSQTSSAGSAHNSGMTPESLTRTVQEFLSEASSAVVLESGAVMFDLAQAKYSISGEYNKCLLHLWSSERNTVRRVLDAELKNGTLRLAVMRLGQTRPTKLEICRERDRRSPTVKRAARTAYEPRLRRAIERHFPGLAISRLTTGVDLEKSFGPIYARGLLRQGQTAFAVLGVNGSELQSSIDAALTFGILWLDACRQNPHPVAQNATRVGQPRDVLVEGLILFVPVEMFGAWCGSEWRI